MSATTAYGVQHLLAKHTGSTVTIDPLTTMNTTFNLNAGTSADSFSDIKLQYIAIGAGGHMLDCVADQTTDVPRSPLLAVLYKQIPFAVVLDGEPTPSDYATKYRMKVTKDNNDYYFLKKIDLSSVQPMINVRDVTSPSTTAVPVDLTTENIQDNSKPTTAMVTAAAGKILTVDLPVEVTITEAEFINIKEAAALWYGAAVNTLSEIALCTGAEKTISGKVEAVDIQLATIESENIRLQNALADYASTITLGTQDALYTV